VNQRTNSYNRRKKYRLRRQLFNFPAIDSAEEGGSAQILDATVSDKDDQKLVEELQKQLKDAQERVVRSRADLENQRKRFQKEKDDIRKYAVETFLQDIVNPMDHFALALQSLETATDIGSVQQGVEMIHRELMNVLETNGLQVVNPTDDSFDPNLHEAVGTDYDPEKEEGQILSVMRLGWKLKDRVIRPAMVQVNRKPAEAATE